MSRESRNSSVDQFSSYDMAEVNEKNRRASSKSETSGSVQTQTNASVQIHEGNVNEGFDSTLSDSGIAVSNEGPQFEINRFNRKKQEGTIDVWWLFDDGGLTLLVPYLLSNKKKWKNCKLRVFMAAKSEKDLEGKQSHMVMLLRKFRIEVSTMKVITDLDSEPRPESVQEFNELIDPWIMAEGESVVSHPWKITRRELQIQQHKTTRQIRLRELLNQNSTEATLTVVTLPMPRKRQCSAALYMAWVETLTNNMPPIMLLRGNQENVLTYYS